jgi:pSer/pThr/pTyr-binding forkhead associated (FHA) protein
MALSFEEFLLILRVAMVAVLYLFILQVVLVARRDLRIAPAQGQIAASKAVIGHLVVVDSGPTALTPGQRVDIVSPMTLGRGPTNTVVLESNVISTENTRVYFRNRSLWVEDLGSRNGTFINERPVTANTPMAVKPGDLLRVGDVRFKFAA